MDFEAHDRQVIENLEAEKAALAADYADCNQERARWKHRAEVAEARLATQGREPVAWRYKDEHSGLWHYAEDFEPVRRKNRQALYAAPPAPPSPDVTEATRQKVGRIIEKAILRHGVHELDLKGTIDDADEAIRAALRDPSKEKKDE